MEDLRGFPPKKRKKPDEEGCKIEIKKTSSGKKIIIGKNCTREQIRMLKESGEINLNEGEKDAKKETL